MQNTKKLFPIFLVILSLFSCKTPTDIAYLQDIRPNIPIQTQDVGFIRFEPGDKVNIFVHSRDEQLKGLFNIGNPNLNNTNSKSYTIDKNGNIDFPVLGLIKAKGMTREELARTIKYELISGNLCNDAVVLVEFANMRYSVLGEVKNPGEIEIDKDYVTIVQAISKAGDLTLQGKRKNVLVLRQEGNTQIPYYIDLTRTSSIYSSPVYYIKQNDVIIVEQNKMQKRSTIANGSASTTPGFWMSIASFLTSMAILLLK